MSPTVKLLLFSLASFVFLFIVLLLSKLFIKNEKLKDRMILIVAIITIFIHYSIIPYDAIVGNPIEFGDNMYLPAYPCNVMMWVALVVGLLKKDSKAFSYLSEFLALGGVLCGIIGLCFNYNFLDNPDFSDYGVLKGLLSHVTLLYSALYLSVMGYIKIHTIHNLVSCTIGGGIFLICGLITNTVKHLLGHESINSMYLMIDKDAPLLNFYMICVSGALIILIFGTLYEVLKYPKEERWYYNIKNKNEEKQKEGE